MIISFHQSNCNISVQNHPTYHLTNL